MHFQDNSPFNHKPIPHPYVHPVSLAELEDMVARAVSESIHLEFKRSDALSDRGRERDEIPKDISAFANADGGVIIYGMLEDGHVATGIDAGVAHASFTKEQLEDIIQSNVTPRLDDLRITQIRLTTTHSAYVVSVPRSTRGPHQVRKARLYYKRRNFKAEPMEDYEINDVRSRRVALPALLSIRVEVTQGVVLQFVVENVSDIPASDVTLELDPVPEWKNEPPAIKNGIGSLYPRQKLSYFYGSAFDVLASDSTYLQQFSVSVRYFHPSVQQHVTDHFHIDLTSLLGALRTQTDLQIQAERIEKAMGKLTQELNQIRQVIDTLSDLANPTGLALSVTTLRNIAHLMGTTPHIEKLDPKMYSWNAYQEVLGVDVNMAFRLERAINDPTGDTSLQNVEGMTPELMERLQKFFILPTATG